MSGTARIEDFMSGTAGSSSHGVRVDNRATFTMEGGTIHGNRLGVRVNNATFDMKGGTISLTSTGGYTNRGIVTAENGGVFNMTGGTIDGGSPGYQTAGVLVTGANSRFNMSGASTSIRNLDRVDGSGIRIESGGRADMSGGEIRNVAGGVRVGNATVASTGNVFNMSGGTISRGTSTLTPYSGVRVFAGGTFNLTGGTIQGFDRANLEGVRVAGGTFDMNGGTIRITESAATSAPVGTVNVAGVRLSSGNFHFRSGMISGDGSAVNDLNGVLVHGSGTAFRMYNSTAVITDFRNFGNATTYSSGVRLNQGTFTMDDGQINNSLRA